MKRQKDKVIFNRLKSNEAPKVHQWLRHYLRQVVLPTLASVQHELCQPFFSLIHFLLAKGLGKKISNNQELTPSTLHGLKGLNKF